MKRWLVPAMLGAMMCGGCTAFWLGGIREAIVGMVAWGFGLYGLRAMRGE